MFWNPKERMRLKPGKYHAKRGEAYAILDFKDEMEIKKIEDELNHIGENAEKYSIPSGINVYVAKTNPSDVHPDLDKCGVGNYIIKAILPGATNEEAANELGQIANYLCKGIKPSSIEVGHKKHGRFHYEVDGKGEYRHIKDKS